MNCSHRATFLARYAAKKAVMNSRIFEAYWWCESCKHWVAGSFSEAPLKESPSKGIFNSLPDHER